MTSNLLGGVSLPLCAIFLAAVIRGYGGFGFSLAAVPLLGTWLPLNQAVPLSLVLEMVGVLPSITRIWRLTRWRDLTRLVIASFLTAPVGILVLHVMPPTVLKPAICVAVLLCVVWIWRPSLSVEGPDSRLYAAIAGSLSGFLNGAAAMSGPPIIVYFLGRQNVSLDSARATMMMFFSIGASVTLAVGLYLKVYQQPPTLLLGASLVPLYVGVEVGTFLISKHTPGFRRRMALIFLAFVASFSLLQSLN